MSTKTIGVVLLVIGVLIVIGGLFAGYIGLSHSTALSLKKELMAGAGVVIGIVGVVLMSRKK